jgi:hypothetical protein
MGIDIYMRWDGQTEAEEKAQYTGFSVQHGHVGYLREAYHGGPYATKVLVGEAWNDDKAIPAATLRERLPATLKTVAERSEKVYGDRLDIDTSPVAKAFVDFVELAERKERETGKPVTIHVSA